MAKRDYFDIDDILAVHQVRSIKSLNSTHCTQAQGAVFSETRSRRLDAGQLQLVFGGERGRNGCCAAVAGRSAGRRGLRRAAKPARVQQAHATQNPGVPADRKPRRHQPVLLQARAHLLRTVAEPG
ncbi:hypothetical protein AYI70_g8894 [Smittium culicis]|uniref:Uncharacterized protein n=1 Tax=Smittium culicis TaxID=133412 RepID=A0A1R1XDT5_9FUNG|nr:hypothetical protein AYI70_g8894 [Smittium culicis]